jgi:signal transduction histidine kinase/phage shock protein PspC (stress-responsive transcriptional regulator)
VAPKEQQSSPPKRHLSRRANGRVVAGVASGLGDSLQIDPVLVRLGFVVLSLASGLGIVVYGVLWVLLPQTSADGQVRKPGSIDSDTDLTRGLAFGSIVLGAVLLVRRTGVWFPDGLMWPTVLTAAGLSMTWRRLPGTTDPHDRLRGVSERGIAGLGEDARRFLFDDTWSRRSMGRMAMGGVLIFLGAATFIATSGSLAALRQGFVAAVILFAGMGMLVAPWLMRLSRQATDERRERIRSEERSVMAAHLHDSVLQTLAIIQKKANNPRDVMLLARRQERELRTWLYDGTEAVHDRPRTFAQAIAAAADSVEADHGVVIEVVQVGDAAASDRVMALVAASREAMVNAAKHSGATEISVFVEVEQGTTGRSAEVFVRDRGKGFDTSLVPEDRRGIRYSLVQRMERVDGTARIHSEIGEGTEVQLVLPLPRVDAQLNAQVDAEFEVASDSGTAGSGSSTMPTYNQPLDEGNAPQAWSI